MTENGASNAARDRSAGNARPSVAYKTIRLPVSRADERRADAYLARLHDRSELAGLSHDARTAWALLDAARSGLERDEWANGYYAWLDGLMAVLPRPVQDRATRRARLVAAVRAGYSTWRGM